MTLVEFLVVLGACLIGVLIGAVAYERYICRPADKLVGAALDRAVLLEKQRAKSKDQATAGNGAAGPD